MKDIGHEETEAILKTLERRINREYRQAIEEVQETLDDYLRRFETKDKIWQKWVEDGDKTQRQYNDWRIGQMAIGRRWEEQKEAIAAELTQATEMAKQIAYDTMPSVYAANHDWAAYEVEKGTQLDTEYTLMSRDTAAGILKDRKLYHDPGEETIRRIAEGEEMRWNKKQIQSVMLQGILQGESIPKMATRLATTVGDRDRKASIRNARTMTTGVENAGRVDSYKRAQDMGINTRQQWMATLDGRTRHSHRVLDGEIVDVGKEFSNGCRFPGDPSGPAGEIYNCRCTLIAALKGFERDLSDTSLCRNEKLGDMSYAEWKKAKATSQDILHQDKMAAAMSGAYTSEYKSLNLLEKAANSGNIQMDLQFFAEKGLDKESDANLIKGIRSLKEKIEEHERKIANPEKVYSDWEEMSENHKKGTIKHWSKEVSNFKESIVNREEELRKRGHNV